MDLQWNDDGTVSVDPPKRPKKMTGTRFASVLGLNRWSTPFQMWCEITGAQRMPFEDTIYTVAGKAIEPKQIAYMREAYAMDDLIDPTDVWGPDFFKKTWGNFFSHPVLGGMWDSLLVSGEWDKTPEGLAGATEAVLEFKTTKRAEDWVDGPPEYYALQAALYAWLLDCDDVILVVTILGDGDYEHPEEFVVSAANTTPYPFKISERYPDFEERYVEPALAWWREHVETGESPAFDERADAEYLKEMRNASLNPHDRHRRAPGRVRVAVGRHRGGRGEGGEGEEAPRDGQEAAEGLRRGQRRRQGHLHRGEGPRLLQAVQIDQEEGGRVGHEGRRHLREVPGGRGERPLHRDR